MYSDDSNNLPKSASCEAPQIVGRSWCGLVIVTRWQSILLALWSFVLDIISGRKAFKRENIMSKRFFGMPISMPNYDTYVVVSKYSKLACK